ncbi:FadR/GntR family transcriptional regulator [Mycolicibacterium baixiangningiae]|uniref:FadR/GntR family transcriptional regulator n=1 Tax=Mycolicibacterium baixiangningiae TaxID=2761578 RepID=UPI001867FA83|nr:FCD domain-containing protein [Mycolicibacterium baixiangningiae]
MRKAIRQDLDGQQEHRVECSLRKPHKGVQALATQKSASSTGGARASGLTLNLAPPIGRTVVPAASTSMADQVANQIAEVIEKLKPGDRLGTKQELREQARVSIGTINETLRVLQSRGLIEVRRGPQGGLFVAERSPMAQLGHAVLHLDTDVSSITEAMDIRDALDPLLIEDAVRYSSAQQVKVMRRYLARMADAVDNDDGIGFLRANWKLHEAIADVSPRPILQAFYVSLLNLIEDHTITVAGAADQPLAGFHRDRYEVHSRLVDAIADRNLPEALAVLAEHNAGIARPS